ncbi:MAG: HAMP domain-containing protein, partial [Emcibacteraceae bacterium]|nr:HAMP domain-containing protein [Emcibacteraceae bacterium]
MTDLHEKAQSIVSKETFLFWEELIIAIIVAVGSGYLSLKIIASITNPLNRIQQSMTTLANGDLEAEVSDTELGSEIGDMANAVQAFKESAITQRRLEKEALEAQEEAIRKAEEERLAEFERKEQEMEAERKTIEARAERAAKMEELISGFDAEIVEVMQGLVASSTQLASSADTMNNVASDTEQHSSQAAAASEQASNNVNTVAAATEEMSASINEISRQVHQSTEMTRKAVTEVEDAKHVVEEIVEKRKAISEG